MTKYRDNLYILAKHTILKSDLIKAKTPHNKCNISKKYFNTLFNNVTFPREGWKLINNFMPSSNGIRQIKHITFNNVVLTEHLSSL